MEKILTQWKVQSHGELVELEPGLLTVEGEIHMPLGNFPRRMTVVALASGGTAIWSPIALREEDMRRIEVLGAPEWLVVPGVAHRLDARIWKDRYPNAKVLCAPGAREKVEEAVPVDATSDPFGDPDVLFQVVPGAKDREAALLVRRSGCLTLVVNDLIANVRHPHGVGAHVMARIFGFGVKQPRMPRVGKQLFLDDASALAHRFREWAAMEGLARIIPSHGEVIDEAVPTLLRVAEDIDTNVPASHIAHAAGG